LELLIGLGAILILDILALKHIASSRTKRDSSRDSWRPF
jgi:hypothetical protein